MSKPRQGRLNGKLSLMHLIGHARLDLAMEIL
jgi:hypothetical protein